MEHLMPVFLMLCFLVCHGLGQTPCEDHFKFFECERDVQDPRNATCSEWLKHRDCLIAANCSTVLIELTMKDYPIEQECGTRDENDSGGTTDNNDSGGTTDKNDSSGTTDKNDSVGTRDENDSVGTTDNNDSVGARDENDSVGTTDKNDSSGARDKNDSSRTCVLKTSIVLCMVALLTAYLNFR